MTDWNVFFGILVALGLLLLLFEIAAKSASVAPSMYQKSGNGWLLVIIGVVLWLVETKIPMDDSIRVVIRVIVVIAVCLYLLSAFGVTDMPLPHLR